MKNKKILKEYLDKKKKQLIIRITFQIIGLIISVIGIVLLFNVDWRIAIGVALFILGNNFLK